MLRLPYRLQLQSSFVGISNLASEIITQSPGAYTTRWRRQTDRQVVMSTLRHADPEFCLPRKDRAELNYSLY